MNKIALRSQDLSILRDIFKKYFTSSVDIWAFGSRVKQSARQYSDLDLLIDYQHQPLPHRLLTQILSDLEESDLPFRVDIVDWNAINNSFRTQISQDKQLLYTLA